MAPVTVATGCQKAVGVKATPLCSGIGGCRIIPQATVGEVKCMRKRYPSAAEWGGTDNSAGYRGAI